VIESQSHRSRKLRRLSRSLDPSRLKNTSEATKSCGGTTAAHPAKSMPDHRTRNVGSSMATPDNNLRRNDEVGRKGDRGEDMGMSALLIRGPAPLMHFAHSVALSVISDWG